MKIQATFDAVPEDPETTRDEVFEAVAALIGDGDAVVPDSDPRRWVAISGTTVEEVAG